MLKCGGRRYEKMRTARIEPQFMSMAWDVAQQSNCRRREVGVVVALNGTVVITATNGTPAGVIPCNEGGCLRCLSDTPSGELYDSCLCIHAEQSAIAQAAQTGLQIGGATLYCTLRPCLTCVKLCLKAGILNIVYDEGIQFTSDIEEAYEQCIKETGLSIIKCSKHNSSLNQHLANSTNKGGIDRNEGPKGLL